MLESFSFVRVIFIDEVLKDFGQYSNVAKLVLADLCGQEFGNRADYLMPFDRKLGTNAKGRAKNDN